MHPDFPDRIMVGVTPDKGDSWQAYCTFNGKSEYLGQSFTAEDLCRLYDLFKLAKNLGGNTNNLHGSYSKAQINPLRAKVQETKGGALRKSSNVHAITVGDFGERSCI